MAGRHQIYTYGRRGGEGRAKLTKGKMYLKRYFLTAFSGVRLFSGVTRLKGEQGMEAMPPFNSSEYEALLQ